MSEDILERAKAALGSWEGCEYDHCKLPDAVEELIAEVERLRSANPFDVDVSVAMRVFDDHFVYGSEESTKILQELCDGITSMKARIKELEAHEQQTHEILGKILGNDDSLETVARRAITKIERLEAAFLDSLAARLYYEHYPGVSDAYSWHDYPEEACHSMPKEEFRKKAREALARIKEGKG